jgi:hypothetical protein
LAKELKHFPYVLTNKFVAGGIIANLPPSWKDFATSLKHKRQEFNVADLIGTLDVEERARGKDNNGKDHKSFAANMVQKRNFHASRNFKNKNKGFDCGGLFRLSLMDVCNNVVNAVSVCDETDLWHSRLCLVNFGCLTRLENMSLILKFNHVKGSKCHACVQSKQTRKPHKAAQPRNLAPLELVHSDLCEMNGVLTKCGKRYFMV